VENAYGTDVIGFKYDIAHLAIFLALPNKIFHQTAEDIPNQRFKVMWQK
jgi:hypothetical protein